MFCKYAVKRARYRIKNISIAHSVSKLSLSIECRLHVMLLIKIMRTISINTKGSVIEIERIINAVGLKLKNSASLNR